MERDLLLIAAGLLLGAVPAKALLYKAKARLYPHGIEKPAGWMPHSARRRGMFALSRLRPSIVMLGDSLTEEGDWPELLGRSDVANRGVGGDKTADILARVDEIAALKPRLIFIMAGTNDAASLTPPEESAANMRKILDALSASRIVFQFPPPTRGDNSRIDQLNAAYRDLLADYPHIETVDLAPLLSDARGRLRVNVSVDAKHLSPRGYEIWRDRIAPLVDC